MASAHIVCGLVLLVGGILEKALVLEGVGLLLW